MDAALPHPADLAEQTSPWALSVVVPACNAVSTLEGTLKALLDLPGGPPDEIIVVENGSQDETWELLAGIQERWHGPSRLVALQSQRGIGEAYRAGVAASRGSHVLLTADDLPFGASDVEAVLACRSLPEFAIGSKAHPRSRVPRSVPRRIATAVFRLLRRLVLGLDVGDTQGTFLIEGELARLLVARTIVPGFGMTTELVALAAVNGVRPVELPVVLTESSHASRIHWLSDSVDMLVSLIQLRRRVGSPRHPRVLVATRAKA